MKRSASTSALFLFSLALAANVYAQEASARQEAFVRLEERGLVVDGGIDAAGMTAQIERGDLQNVELFLAAGIDPDVPDGLGRRPLLVAAEGGHAAIVRALLDAGADPTVRDRMGRTAFVLAAAREHAEVIEVLAAAPR